MLKIADHSEKELFRRINDGDEAAFRSIYDSYFPRVSSFVYKLSKSVTVTEEVVQDVFMRIWSNRGNLQQVNNTEAYIFSIARNRTIDYLRLMAKDSLLIRELDLLILQHPQAAEDKLSLEDLQKVINQALGQLSPQKQAVYRLSKNDGLSHDEIAQQLNLSRSTVKNHLSETLRHIRGHVSTHYDSELLLLIILINFR